MEFEKQPSPNGFCVFCEDIRQEVSNKQTYVGVFAGSEFNVLGVLPAVIGKFSIHTMFKQRLSEGLDPVVIEVHMPGDDDDKPTARTQAPIEELVSKLPPPAADNDDPFVGVGVGFEFNPLEIKREGKIVVSAIKGGKRYRLGVLRVKSQPPPPQEAAN